MESVADMQILTEIHRSFYAAYDARPPDAADEDPPPMGCDVEVSCTRARHGLAVRVTGCIVDLSVDHPRHEVESPRRMQHCLFRCNPSRCPAGKVSRPPCCHLEVSNH